MTTTDRWQLPDGVNELLPDKAWRVEKLRRQIIDICYRWGYELVMPPLIEYLESLMIGAGETLDLQTFKIIDQHNGRTLGVRADMTTQVARMDAHALSDSSLNRLCYTGTVLRARSDGAGSSRTPLQFGAELYGHPGPESDSEIIQLMLENVCATGLKINDMLLDMGHVGVYRALINSARLHPELEAQIYDAMIRGSHPEIVSLLGAADCSARHREELISLMTLSGHFESVLKNAYLHLGNAGAEVLNALENLKTIVESVIRTHPKLLVHLDLAELRGYRYHTGTIFTLFENSGVVIASGGRYDAIGEAFGHPRPATGFSGDLVNLERVCARFESSIELHRQSGVIWVERCDDDELHKRIKALRANGERVLVVLEDEEMSPDYRFDRKLVLHEGEWVIESLEHKQS
ncbi:MAG: ATP phosphoribosyltransferase regulatory subunit [Granulosicoccus sp.]|nr:ATP phosphoribosyltransferase regulatory subunit [Granulosicoccus sp.]